MTTAKPAFDPSKPFQTVGDAGAGAKPKFDPNQPFQTVGGQDQTAPGDLTPQQTSDAAFQRMNESGNASNDALFNTLTLGHLPQIKAKIGQVLAGEGVSNDQNYVKRRDQEIADEAARAGKYPLAHAEGTVTGFALPMLASMGLSSPAAAASAAPLIEGATEAAPAAAKAGYLANAAKGLIRGGAAGATMGFAQNPGDTPGVVDPLQLEARAKNAAIAAPVGGLIGVGTGIIPNLADTASQYSAKKAVRAVGAMLKDFRKEYANDSVEKTGRFALDNGLVQAGDTYESTAAKASKMQDDVGTSLGAGYNAAQKIISRSNPEAQAKIDAAGFSPARDKAAILAKVKSDLGYAFKGKSAANAVSDYLDQLIEQHGDQVLNPATTNKIKTSLDKSAIDWERNPLAREPDAEAALKSLRSALSQKVSDQVQAVGEAIGDKNAAKNLAEMNSRYGMASKIARIAGDRANREAANNALGLGEKIGGGVGAMVGTAVAGVPGAIVGGVGGAAANKAARMYGPQVVASGANKIAQALSSVPEISAATLANPAISKSVAGLSGAGSLPSAGAFVPAAAQNQPTKGPDKWANDGLQKLFNHASGKDKADIQKSTGAMLSDPKLKDLLIQASDVNAGSKSMEKILSKVKEQLAQQGED